MKFYESDICKFGMMYKLLLSRCGFFSAVSETRIKENELVFKV